MTSNDRPRWPDVDPRCAPLVTSTTARDATPEAFSGGITMNVIGVLMEAGRTGRAVRVQLVGTGEVIVGFPVEYRVGGAGNSVVIRRDHSMFGDAGRLLVLTSIARVELLGSAEDLRINAPSTL